MKVHNETTSVGVNSAGAACDFRDPPGSSSPRRLVSLRARTGDRHRGLCRRSSIRHGTGGDHGNRHPHVHASAFRSEGVFSRCLRSRDPKGRVRRRIRVIQPPGPGAAHLSDTGVESGPTWVRQHHLQLPSEDRDVLLPEVRDARRAGMELRRRGIALRLAPDLQRCQRPFHRQVHDHCGASLCGGLERKAGRDEGESGRHAHVPLGTGKADPELPDDGGRRGVRAGAHRQSQIGFRRHFSCRLDSARNGKRRGLLVQKHSAHGGVFL